MVHNPVTFLRPIVHNISPLQENVHNLSPLQICFFVTSGILNLFFVTENVEFCDFLDGPNPTGSFKSFRSFSLFIFIELYKNATSITGRRCLTIR